MAGPGVDSGQNQLSGYATYQAQAEPGWRSTIKVLVNYGDGCLWPGGSLW